MPIRSILDGALAPLLCAGMIGLAACDSGSEGGAYRGGDTSRHAHQGEHGDQHAASGQEPERARTNVTRFEFVSEPPGVRPGEPATWTLRFFDAATGAPVARFDTTHDKPAHLIVASDDLRWFNHLHPEYRGNGEFTVDMTLPKSGSYIMFADYKVAGQPGEVARHEFATTGTTLALAPVAAAPDPIGDGGWIVKSARSHPEGKPDESSGDSYQVALMPMPARPAPGEEVTLHFQVRDAGGKPVADLQPYLGAMGHAVLISNDFRTYLHAHPAGGAGEDAGHQHGGSTSSPHAHAAPAAGGPDVTFHTTFPAGGTYMLWGGFRHRDRIITAPFVLESRSR